MSNDVKALSISFRSDNGCIEHNNRDFFTDNVDRLIYSASDFEHFIKLLEANKYEVRRRKYIAVKPPYAKRPFRLKSLGADYSECSLKKRIEDRNKVSDSFLQDEYTASRFEEPFYARTTAGSSMLIRTTLTLTTSPNSLPLSVSLVLAHGSKSMGRQTS